MRRRSPARIVGSHVNYRARVCTYGRFGGNTLAFNALGLHITSTTFHDFTIANLSSDKASPFDVILQERCDAILDATLVHAKAAQELSLSARTGIGSNF
jgi:hypothetical protein